MYLYHNRMVGGLRFRQEAREVMTCPGDPEIVSAIYGAPCYPDEVWDTPDGLSKFAMDSQFLRAPGAEPALIRTGLTQSEVRRELRRFEDAMWFRPRVRKMEVSFLSYNGGLHGITITYMLFFFTRGGHILKHVEPVTLLLNPYNMDSLWVIPEVIWLLLVFRIFIGETHDVIRYLRQLGFRRGIAKYAGFWNIVDWISVIFAYSLVGLWVAHCNELQSLSDSLMQGDRTVSGTWTDTDVILAFFDDVDVCVMNTLLLRRLMAYYCFVIGGRLLKAFSAQPRLALVTKTLVEAAVDIVHFGIVFLAVFMAYAVSGMLLFGEDHGDFAYMSRSLVTCWRLLHGDYDWDSLEQIGRPEATVWFLSFTILVLMIMLNMLLAVIMNVYTSVKTQAQNSETLYSQLEEIAERAWRIHKGKEIDLHVILKILDPTDLDEEDCGEFGGGATLNSQGLAGLVDGLSEEQATDIIMHAMELQKEMDDPEKKMMSTAIPKISSMCDLQERIQSSIDELIELTQVLAEGMGPDPESNRPKMSSVAPQQNAHAGMHHPAQKYPAPGAAPSLQHSGHLPVSAVSALEQVVAARVEPSIAALATSRELVRTQVDSMKQAADAKLKDIDKRVASLARQAEKLTKT